MRILFSFAGGNGHFVPLLPIAQAAQAEGHTIAFTGRQGMLASIQAAGFTAFPSGLDFGDSNERFPLLEVNMEREEAALRDFFAGRLARTRAQDILELAEN